MQNKFHVDPSLFLFNTFLIFIIVATFEYMKFGSEIVADTIPALVQCRGTRTHRDRNHFSVHIKNSFCKKKITISMRSYCIDYFIYFCPADALLYINPSPLHLLHIITIGLNSAEMLDNLSARIFSVL